MVTRKWIGPFGYMLVTGGSNHLTSVMTPADANRRAVFMTNVINSSALETVMLPAPSTLERKN
jgi:hypothetical protein